MGPKNFGMTANSTAGDLIICHFLTFLRSNGIDMAEVESLPLIHNFPDQKFVVFPCLTSWRMSPTDMRVESSRPGCGQVDTGSERRMRNLAGTGQSRQTVGGKQCDETNSRSV